MGLKKNIEKLDAYFDRLRRQKVEKIKPSHVEKVLLKLRAKETELLTDLETSAKDSKSDRLKTKLTVVREQIRRGEWLMREIEPES
ncbi:hypothetical protein ACFMPD_05545 [Sedimentitalea sp. HM32M-2]|uniref:hypothetical protein n=1 Tax=Sedimentitalea sp. HM32M-2 TaxID=3351566 RepID=UPI00363C1901